METQVLNKFLNKFTLVLPPITPSVGQNLKELDLKGTLFNRHQEIVNGTEHDHVFQFVDHVDDAEGKGSIDQFIWNLWEDTDISVDEMNLTIMENKLVNDVIVTTLSPGAINLLVSFLYNGFLPDGINYEDLLELGTAVANLNLNQLMQRSIFSGMTIATSLPNLRRVWGSGKGLGSFTATKNNAALLTHSVAFIICNVEEVFSGSDRWSDIPEQLLEMLMPSTLSQNLEEYVELGATLEKRKVYSKGGDCFLRISHFDLFRFLVEWAKLKYEASMVEEENEIFQPPNDSQLREIVGDLITMINPETFDVSKFVTDPSVKDAKAFVNYLEAYIIMKNLIPETEERQEALEIPELTSPQSYAAQSNGKRRRLNHDHTSTSQRPVNVLAIEGTDSTLTVDLIGNLFALDKLADTTVILENGEQELRLHSYVLRLRNSAFCEYFNSSVHSVKVFNLGDLTLDSAKNFFKTFYVTKSVIKDTVRVDAEFCFMALLFKVDFLLETVYMHTKSSMDCPEIRVMHYVSASRRNSRFQGRPRPMDALIIDMRRDLLDLMKTVSFRFLIDEEQVVELFRNYQCVDPGFYYNVVSELESLSVNMTWLRKENNEKHLERMKEWKSNGVIRLDKVSKDQLKDLARRKFIEMEDAIEYSYAIGCNSKSTL